MKYEYTIEEYTYTIEFVQRSYWRNVRHVGSVSTTETQCIMKRNGIVIGLGLVKKHMDEKHNSFYACRNSLIKAMAMAKYVHAYFPEEMRKYFWDQILLLKTTNK